MLARLVELLESWDLERSRWKRIVLRRLHELLWPTTFALQIIFWSALVFTLSVAGEIFLAFYTNREPNLIGMIAIGFSIVFIKKFAAQFIALIRTSLRRMPLLPAVLAAATGGAGIAWFSWWFLNKWFNPTTKAPDPIDITKLALTIAGGVGAIVALVVAYRRQRDIEQGRFTERFGAAAAQLGAPQVAVRLAGVYAMTGVANDSKGLQRQQCIDVLCGYLRLPYAPERGANYQTKHIEKIKESSNPNKETENHFEYLHNDSEVRRTIVRVIADHLRKREPSWAAADFDLRQAYIERADFSHVTFKGEALFGGATFASDAIFLNAKFAGGATNFDQTKFLGQAFFDYAKLTLADFSDAKFEKYTSFRGAKFEGSADFRRSTFNEAEFHETYFWGDANFTDATFTRLAIEAANFDGYCAFDRATFRGTVVVNSHFSTGASFTDVDFGVETVDFSRVQRWGGRRSRFDWSDDHALKPSNVLPDPWPSGFP